MSCPSCVSNAGMRDKDGIEVRLGLIYEILELCNLANLFVCEDLPFLITVNGHTC